MDIGILKVLICSKPEQSTMATTNSTESKSNHINPTYMRQQSRYNHIYIDMYRNDHFTFPQIYN